MDHADGAGLSARFADRATGGGHEFQKFVAYPISRAAHDQGRAVINWIAEREFAPDHAWRR